MRQLVNARTVVYGLLIAGAVATFIVPQAITVPQLSAQTAPSELRLTGRIRDFRASHPDFEVPPSGGDGHCARNVVNLLGPGGRPMFNSGGDDSGTFDNRVAHWKFDEGSGATASDEMGLNNGTLHNGPSWTTGRADGGLHFDGTNDHVEIPSSPQMQISGDITFAGWFKLDDDFDASSAATMVIMEKFLDTEHDFHIALAGLDYNRPQVSKGSLVFKVEHGPDTDHYCYVWTNRTSWTAGVWYHFAAALVGADASQNALFVNGVDDTDPVKAIGIGFTDTDFDAPMRIGGKTIDYNGLATDIYFKGTIDDVMIFDRALSADDFTASTGGYHVVSEWADDGGNPIAPHFASPVAAGNTDACGNLLADVEGVAGADSDGGITSTDSFDEWFDDRLGTNLSLGHTITLVQNGAAYEYESYDFHPIDGRMFENEGEPHNHNFTYMVPATFTYDACAGQYVEFMGGDGAWLFVNGQLAIDLGGVGSGTSQYVALDRLGLTDGQGYMLHLFYAQRTPTSSTFVLRTNVPLAPPALFSSVSAGFD